MRLVGAALVPTSALPTTRRFPLRSRSAGVAASPNCTGPVKKAQPSFQNLIVRLCGSVPTGVDSAPTIHAGTVLAGCADGWVYCLRLVDGKLIWRLLAARRRVSAVAMGQVESLWPVHGSVLVAGGRAYVTAGRSSYLDGGMTAR